MNLYFKNNIRISKIVFIICFRYVHYEVDGVTSKVNLVNALNSFPSKKGLVNDKNEILPCQWIQCDLRFMDFTFLGKSNIIMDIC